MQVIHERCAGIDVHKKTVVVCVLITHADGTVQKEKRTFTTMTEDLLALEAWLESLQVKHVAMEFNGRVLASRLQHSGRGTQDLLANPQHLKTVPGRKTDIKDSEWIAHLHRHGLLKASFIPPY